MEQVHRHEFKGDDNDVMLTHAQMKASLDYSSGSVCIVVMEDKDEPKVEGKMCVRVEQRVILPKSFNEQESLLDALETLKKSLEDSLMIHRACHLIHDKEDFDNFARTLIESVPSQQTHEFVGKCYAQCLKEGKFEND